MRVERENISDEIPPGNTAERNGRHKDIIKSGRKNHFSLQDCKETVFSLNKFSCAREANMSKRVRGKKIAKFLTTISSWRASPWKRVAGHCFVMYKWHGWTRWQLIFQMQYAMFMVRVRLWQPEFEFSVITHPKKQPRKHTWPGPRGAYVKMNILHVTVARRPISENTGVKKITCQSREGSRHCCVFPGENMVAWNQSGHCRRRGVWERKQTTPCTGAF